MEGFKLAQTQTTKALISYYQAKKDRAMSDLELYLNRPVGIGEHTSVFDDTRKMFESLEKANSMLEFFDTIISKQDNQENNI